jgi:hypothetical protein
VHRHTAVMCAHPYELNACDERGGCDEPCDGLGDGSCTELFEGFCRCAFPCTSDADCSADAACLCASGVGGEGTIPGVPGATPTEPGVRSAGGARAA